MSNGKNRPGSNRGRKKTMLLERDGHRCYLCGGKFEPDDLTLDHKIPYSRGGSNHVNNLALACYPCNQAKDDMTVSEYLSSYLMKKNKIGPGHLRRGTSMQPKDVWYPIEKKEEGLTHALGDYFPREG